MRPAVTTLLGLCCVLPARPASAQAHERAALSVERGPGTEQCIAAAALERAVEFRLHRFVFTSREQAELQIKLALERGANAEWSADLSLRTAAGVSLGERRIATGARHCSALDESVTLVVALLVDSPPPIEAHAPMSSAAPAISPARSEPAPAQPVAPPRPARSGAAQAAPITTIRLPGDTHAPREPWHADVTIGAALSGGILPGVGLGPEASLGLKAPFTPELRGFGGWSVERESTVRSGTSGARFDFAYLGLELCPWSTPSGRLRPFACLGQVVGRLHAEAFGFDQNLTATLLRFALHARLGFAVAIAGPLSARLDGRAELPVTRSVFVYGARDGQESGIYKTAPVAGALELGLALAWR